MYIWRLFWRAHSPHQNARNISESFLVTQYYSMLFYWYHAYFLMYCIYNLNNFLWAKSGIRFNGLEWGAENAPQLKQVWTPGVEESSSKRSRLMWRIQNWIRQCSSIYFIVKLCVTIPSNLPPSLITGSTPLEIVYKCQLSSPLPCRGQLCYQEAVVQWTYHSERSN